MLMTGTSDAINSATMLEATLGKAKHGHMRNISVASTAATDCDSESPCLEGIDVHVWPAARPPVRHTFVHFSACLDMRRTASVPRSFREEVVPSAVALPLLGSAALPSIGSENHARRKCKPCAFAWKPLGCQDNTNCQFCHLCGADERTLRKKHRTADRLQRKRRNLAGA